MKKKGQEEMIGFALIIVLVAVILLIFLGFYLRGGQKESVESYEVNSFIQAFLQYTTDCKDHLEFLSIQKTIFSCDSNEECSDGRNPCDVLKSTLSDILEKSWKVEANITPIKGYELIILVDEEKERVSIKEGEKTNNYKGSFQDFSRSGKDYEIYFNVYY